VQLKGTERPLNADGSLSVEVSRSNLNSLLMHPHSFYAAYHIPTSSLRICAATCAAGAHTTESPASVSADNRMFWRLSSIACGGAARVAASQMSLARPRKSDFAASTAPGPLASMSRRGRRMASVAIASPCHVSPFSTRCQSATEWSVAPRGNAPSQPPLALLCQRNQLASIWLMALHPVPREPESRGAG
jgi:hypothetical protein